MMSILFYRTLVVQYTSTIE